MIPAPGLIDLEYDARIWWLPEAEKVRDLIRSLPAAYVFDRFFLIEGRYILLMVIKLKYLFSIFRRASSRCFSIFANFSSCVRRASSRVFALYWIIKYYFHKKRKKNKNLTWFSVSPNCCNKCIFNWCAWHFFLSYSPFCRANSY